MAKKAAQPVVTPEQSQKNDAKFSQDKQKALDDGYSEEQALQYAEQER